MSLATALPERGSFGAWLVACRPATLLVSVVPVVVGSAIARSQGAFRIGPALAALAGAGLLQIGSNLANDVFDYEKGADTAERLGPTRVTQAGLLLPGEVRAAMIVSFALATIAGAYLTVVAGWPIVAIGVASIISAIAYTGGPWPLGYNGLGDLFVFVFFGFVAVCGTVFVQTGAVSERAWLASVPVGAIATAVLVVNNVRDHRTDRTAGKRTLVVRFGRAFGVAEYGLLLAAAYVVPVVMVLSARASAWALLPLVSLPFAAGLLRTIARTEQGPVLNRSLAATARLLLIHGTLFALGLAHA